MEAIQEWHKTCLRKKKLKEKWANDIILRSNGTVRKYLCPHCQHWHVTSKGVNKSQTYKGD